MRVKRDEWQEKWSFACLSVQQEPFTIVTRIDGVGSNPVHSYRGFVPDLIKMLSKRLRFDYDLYTVSAYGQAQNGTNHWTGMIGEVMRRDVGITFIFYNISYYAD